MKTLEPLNLGRLVHLEFGQHIKSINNGINLLGGIVTDPDFISYMTALNNESTEYDKAMVQIFKSDETAKIVAADLLRDNFVSTTKRALYVFEKSTDENELLAFLSLQTLFNVYGAVQTMNFEEESNAIDNLVTDLNGSKYLPHVTTLDISSFVAKMNQANLDFKLLFDG